ncbi:MAG: hypothetical protein ACFB0A_06385 [Croceivirga sp.]
MSTIQNPRFQIKNQTSESVTYKRIIKSKGRKPKEVQKIEDELPTATIHTFSQEEYEKLKEIESKLVHEIEVKEDKFNNLKKAFFSFFEV